MKTSKHFFEKMMEAGEVIGDINKKFKIRIKPKQLVDKKSAKLMEKMLNLEIDRYKDVISAITIARRVVQDLYGRSTPDIIWDDIMSAVIRMNITSLPTTKLK